MDEPDNVPNTTWGLSAALSDLSDADMPILLLADTTGLVESGIQTPQLPTDLLIQGARSLSTTW